MSKNLPEWWKVTSETRRLLRGYDGTPEWERKFEEHVRAALERGMCPVCGTPTVDSGYYKTWAPDDWVITQVCPRCGVTYDYEGVPDDMVF
ncbi:hypothetical protein D6833_08285 [Candidatus Parcubacteria bacterium]|nr:MAG: hypothetical protein D6833_08285 [Candidatus Parcubacteria bacterium]